MLYQKGLIIRFFMGLLFIASLQICTGNVAKALKEESVNAQPSALLYSTSLQNDLLLLSTGFKEKSKSCSTANSDCSTQQKR